MARSHRTYAAVTTFKAHSHRAKAKIFFDVCRVFFDFYRPQTKIAKVMFSQASVCPGGVSQSLSWGGSLSRGIFSQGGLSGGSLSGRTP